MALLLPLAIAGAVFSMLIPVDSRILDLLVAVNMLFASALLLSASTLSDPLKISSLPTMLVIGTLFRLSLNVSSTRLILLGESPGKIIEVFGNLIVGGELLIGVVLFLIITIVQFLVIAKGAERVAEVSARFTLDALPGKQMSIDADLRAGTLDPNSAREKREELGVESRFYAALDGAMKFIKGDAIAAILIVFINLIGGAVVGAIRGMPIRELVHHFSVLSIGDGLVSQIPALISALSASIVVTRVAKDKNGNLGHEIFNQLGGTSGKLIVLGIGVVAFGLVPGMPITPLLIISTLLFLLGLIARRVSSKNIITEFQESEFKKKRFPTTPLIELQIPESFYNMIGAQKCAEILNRIEDSFYEKAGFALSKLHQRIIRGEDSNELILLLRGIPISRVTLAIQSEQLIISIVETLLKLASELIDESSVRRTIDILERFEPELIAGFLASGGSYSSVAAIGREIVNHGFTLRIFPTIIQVICEKDRGDVVSDKRTTTELIEEIRLRAKRQLCYEICGNSAQMEVVTLATSLEKSLHRAIRASDFESELIIEAIANNLATFLSKNREIIAAVVTTRLVRRLLAETLLAKEINIRVIAYDEIVTGIKLHEVVRISIESTPSLHLVHNG